MKFRILLTAATLAAFAGAAAAATDGISAKDQKIMNKSVVAASVTASKAGYLVVHEADATGTKAGTVLGNVAVKANIGVFKNEAIPNRASIIKAAGTSLAYFDATDEVPKRAFDRLGHAILNRVRLKR